MTEGTNIFNGQKPGLEKLQQKIQERKTESYKIFDQIAPTYDFLNHLLSFGIDILWRKKMMRYLPSSSNPLLALDLACGTGDVTLELARQKNVIKAIGLDLSKEMIAQGDKKIKKKGLEHKAQLFIGDGMNIPCADNSQNVVTLSFGIRNFSNHQTSLKDILRVLKPNGRALIMEFSIPRSFIVRSLYFFYFRKILPFVGNMIAKHGDAYTYLNRTVENFPYGEEFLSHMKAAGFKNVKAIPLTFGIATLYVGDKAHVGEAQA